MNIDKYFLLSLSEEKERYNNCINQLKLLDIYDNTYIYYTCKKNIDLKIVEKLFNTNEIFNARWFSCTYNHYTIIKVAYNLGYENIIILEDDFYCKVNKETFHFIINNKIPKDYDICKFHMTDPSEDGIYDNVYKDYSYNDFLKDHDMNSIFFEKRISRTSTLAYMINRKAMKAIIDYMDNNFLIVPDIVLAEATNLFNLNMYCIKFNFFDNYPNINSTIGY